MRPSLLFSPLLLILHSSSAQAELVASVNGTILSHIPSSTPFELDSNDRASRMGMNLLLPWKANTTSCEPVLEVEDPKQAALKLTSRYTESILFTEWTSAENAGCETFTDVANAAKAYSGSLSIIVVPPARTIVISSGVESADPRYPFSPLRLPGLYSSQGRPDGRVRGMDVVLATVEDVKVLATSIQDKDEAVVYVVWDEGPWNLLFLSIPYTTLLLFLFLATVGVILWAGWSAGRVIYLKQWRANLRNSVFLLSLVSALFFLPVFWLRDRSMPWIVLQALVSLFGGWALQLMLLLWTHISLEACPQRKTVLFLRILISLSCLIHTVNFALTIIMITPTGKSLSSAGTLALTILNALTSLVLIGIFILYSLQFHWRSAVQFISPTSKATLTKLTHLSWTAATFHAGVLITNLISQFRAPSTPGLLLVQSVALYFLMFMRISVLLCVLGVSLPRSTLTPSSKRSGPSGGYKGSGTSSGDRMASAPTPYGYTENPTPGHHV
ncbi:hypothetical protein BJ684DRAFT_19960 [Piptocephalis cylindrospora]|uniref:Lung seven transmembrane receptor-domain-containing protein n=1 Tax=Piptocephalis cylindrospora TaxID=1907219 RepID=A0A4P9Y406_9FUNG|nr:hypothetical protein BJ684DRAFT_19960 [Piptocephalis cylindrospora]|eukprot:RKP13563.1 hypothetical protein BJ684DRAFT_19960 [Piptocephalis cylindrospora]